jgi:hypothetical protein
MNKTGYEGHRGRKVWRDLQIKSNCVLQFLNECTHILFAALFWSGRNTDDLFALVRKDGECSTGLPDPPG